MPRKAIEANGDDLWKTRAETHAYDTDVLCARYVPEDNDGWRVPCRQPFYNARFAFKKAIIAPGLPDDSTLTQGISSY